MKQADAILSADWHIRDTIPECRSDDFLTAQYDKFEFLSELQILHNCPVLVAGDVYDYWKPTPELLSWSFDMIPSNTYTIPGNHDLQAHSLKNIGRSGAHALAAGRGLQLFSKGHGLRKCYKNLQMFGFPFGVKLRPCKPDSKWFRIAIVHKFIYKGKEPFPGAAEVGSTAKTLLKKMSGYDLILTGDNHQTFTATLDDALLVNPGSFMRTTATQIDHKPCVFLWYAAENRVEKVFLPAKEGVITREHLDVVNERKERESVFIEKLNSDVELSHSFTQNMKGYLSANHVDESVKEMIWESMDA